MSLPLVAAALLQLSPPADLPKGVVVRSVTCLHEPQQSYALYVPSDYTPQRSWPILYAFEPVARGWLPVERFRAAAEELGYIVVGSNNSRNGSWAASIRAANALWGDTHARFAIDPKRVYTTGFSGGARVATGVGVMTDAVAGVIAVGGGLPSQVSARDVRFPLLAVAGTTDMNLREAWELTRDLRKKGRTSELLEFEGGHQWLPEAQARLALQWMQLEAMRSGRMPVDEAWVEALRAGRTAAARRLSGGPAYQAWHRLDEEFAGLADTAEAKARLRSLQEEEAVRDWLQRREDLFDEEQKLRFGLEKAYLEVGTPIEKSLRWWAHRAEQIRSRRKGAESDETAMLTRVLEAVWRAHYEASVFASDAATDLAHARVAAAVAPDSAWLAYNLARSLARSGDDGEALQVLARAFELGFDDRARLDQEEAFRALRRTDEFRALLQRADATSKPP